MFEQLGLQRSRRRAGKSANLGMEAIVVLQDHYPHGATYKEIRGALGVMGPFQNRQLRDVISLMVSLTTLEEASMPVGTSDEAIPIYQLAEGTII